MLNSAMTELTRSQWTASLSNLEYQLIMLSQLSSRQKLGLTNRPTRERKYPTCSFSLRCLLIAGVENSTSETLSGGNSPPA